MTTRLRIAVPADAEQLLALAVAFYAEDGFTTSRADLAQRWRHLLASDTARTVVAETPGGTMMGFALTTTSYGLENGLVAELEDLFVDKAYRRRGVGAELVAASLAWARSIGAAHLAVVVAPQGHEIAGLLCWYSGLGFVDDGRRLLALPV